MSGPDLLGALAQGKDPAAARTRSGVSRAADEARTDSGAPRCSRKGCAAAAVWAVEWNNPRVHAPDRVKTWAACEQHRRVLADFVGDRGFLLGVRRLDAGDDAAPPLADRPVTGPADRQAHHPTDESLCPGPTTTATAEETP